PRRRVGPQGLAVALCPGGDPGADRRRADLDLPDRFARPGHVARARGARLDPADAGAREGRASRQGTEDEPAAVAAAAARSARDHALDRVLRHRPAELWPGAVAAADREEF